MMKILAVSLFLLFCPQTFSDVMASPIDHLRLTWSDDPSTTMNVIWNAVDDKASRHVLYYDTEDFGGLYRRYKNNSPVHFIRNSFGMENNYVRLKNLIPGQKYYFVIVSEGRVSRRYWFQTISDSQDAELSILAGGDSRNNRLIRRRGNELVSKLRADAVFFAGDMTAFGSSFEWKNWFGDWQLTISPDGRVTPIVAARGNHEKTNEMLEHLFDTPSEVYYALSFGGNLFRALTLNSEGVIGGAQTDWLEQELKSESGQNALWKFAQYHVPMRAHTRSKKPGTHQYRYWAPLFQQHLVDFVLEADSHTVKMTYPVVPSSAPHSVDGFLRNDQEGTIYLGEGTWGAPLRRNNNDRSWTMASGSFSQFKWMIVNKNQVELRTVVINDPDDVEAVKDDNRLAAPKGLELWNPGTHVGDKLIIKRKRSERKHANKK